MGKLSPDLHFKKQEYVIKGLVGISRGTLAVNENAWYAFFRR